MIVNTTTPLLPEREKREYIIVADKTSRVLKSSMDWYEIVKYAAQMRRAGGEVTIFKATKA